MIALEPSSNVQVIFGMAEIPASHADLIDGPYVVALSTIMPDGQPQTTPVWCNRRDGFVFVNVMRGFRKFKNMQLNPHVTLLAYEPRNPVRNIEIRGCVVEMTAVGAVEHNDELARLYLNKTDAKFFGDAVPAELAARYTPIRVRIAPTHVRVEG